MEVLKNPAIITWNIKIKFNDTYYANREVIYFSIHDQLHSTFIFPIVHKTALKKACLVIGIAMYCYFVNININ